MHPWSAVPSWLAPPSRSLGYQVYARAYAVSTAWRLLLPDAVSPEWLLPALIHWLGAGLLLLNGMLLGWLLCVIGLAWPLLGLGDQLTKSVYLLACALAAIACFAGRSEGREQRMGEGLRFSVRCLTVLLYLLAATHKLNRDFFDPAVSCAAGGVEVLARDWGLGALDSPRLERTWAPLFVGVEFALAAGLVLRPGLAIVLGLAMHIPLTIVFAPSFTFAVASGWTACLSEADLRHLGATLRRRWPVVLAGGGALATLSLWHHARQRFAVDPAWCIDEALQFLLLAWVLAAWWRRPAGVLGWLSGWRERPPRHALRVAVALVAVGVANGLTPYLGVQFQHAAAMLSNLRVDRGCWNSLIFPEAMRLTERYIRVDRASVAPGQGAPERAARVEEQLVRTLWNTESLGLARRRWCRAKLGAIRLQGTWLERPFETRDFCAPDGWPFGASVLPRFRAFQANLSRRCPQRCVH